LINTRPAICSPPQCWSYFAAVESFGRIAQRQADMVDNPGLSYGYFYVDVAAIERYGVVQSVRFPEPLFGLVAVLYGAADLLPNL